VYPGLEEGTWTPFKVRELREGEDLAQLLGAKNDKNKKGGPGKVKKDVVIGNGAPKATKAEEGSKLEGGKETGSVQEERPASETATSTEGSAIPATGVAVPAPTPALATPKGTPKPAVDEDTDIPDADDNENDEDELEEGELEEGDEGEEEAPDAEEMALSDDEDLAEGEQIIEDIIEMPEAENGVIYVEDEDEEEGAVYPMQGGKVVNWGAFFALLWVSLHIFLFLVKDGG